MGASGSVSYLFDNKGVIVFVGEDADAVFEQLLEADVDVDDVEAEEGTITVYTAPTDLHKAIVALRECDSPLCAPCAVRRNRTPGSRSTSRRQRPIPSAGTQRAWTARCRRAGGWRLSWRPGQHLAGPR